MPKRQQKTRSDARRSAASRDAKAIETVAVELAQQAERLSVEFIRTELEMGLTFAKAAESYKDPHRIKQATDNATVAYRA
jgi:hypothetical protein